MSRRTSIVQVILTAGLLLTGPGGARGPEAQRAATAMPTAQPQQTRTQLGDGTWLLTGGAGAVAGAIAIADLQTATLVPVPGSLLAPRSGHTATVLPDGTVLIAGGVSPNGDLVSLVCLLYTSPSPRDS